MTHTSRRALLSAALAAGGTVAATGSALAPQPNQDAEIVALSAAILAGHGESARLSLAEDDLGRTVENQHQRSQLRARQEKLTREGWDMRARLAAMQATTPAGLQAKARVAREFSDVEELGSAYNDEALLWSIANDVLGVPSRFRGKVEEADASPSSSPTSPDLDAELITLCGEFVSLDRRYLTLADELGSLLPHDPRAAGIDKEMNVLASQAAELADDLTERTPVTLAGVLALAHAAQHQLSGDACKGASNVPSEGELAWNAIESLVALMNRLGVRAEAALA